MFKQGLMLAAATLALSACNNHSADQAVDNGAAMSDAGVTDNAMASTAPAMTDAGVTAAAATPAATGQEFVQKIGISDMYEIESSKLAQTRSRSPEIVAFAKQMVADHTATTAKIKTISAKDAALKPPTALDDRHQKLIADLKAATPDTFDTLYADQQTKGHEEAHALLTSYAAGGDNADLKAFAGETAPKVQGHLDMIRKLDATGADDTTPGAPRR